MEETKRLNWKEMMSDESVLHISVLQVFYYYFFFPLWLSVSLDLAARVALGSSFYPYLDIQECDTSRYALRNFNIFWPAALKKMCVRVSVCVERVEGVGGGGVRPYPW